MKRGTIEIFVGFFMLLGLLALLMLAIQVSGLRGAYNNGSYNVTAVFQNVGDLKVRAPVSLAGVKIGEVAGIQLDNQNFDAKVTLNINSNYNQIPKEGTTASIYTAGLLGANYISITPGFGEQYLQKGDTIVDTQPALVLENIISQFIYKLNNDKSDTKKS